MEPGPSSPRNEDPEAPFRVLCVDDNHDMADSTALVLKIVGFDTLACYDGFTALEQAADFRPHVCFLDLDMPGMNGCELAVRLRQWAAGRPILLVALTAMGSDEHRERIVAAGFDLHLIKPVDPFKLVSVVDTMFRKYSGANPLAG